MDGLLVFLAQTLTAATPLVLAALGGTLSERAGIATVALEGYMLLGAFAAAVGALASGSIVVALGAAMLAGALAGLLLAWGTVTLRANAIVVGVAVNLLAAAGTRAALKVLYDSASNSPPLLTRAARHGSVGTVALLEALTQPVTWLLCVAFAGVWWLLSRSIVGLHVQAAGEHPEACAAQGISVPRVRYGALCAGGALAALGGAHLSLNQHEFVAYMSGGRGFLALAAVILGNWRPGRAVFAAVFIGGLYALEASLSSYEKLPKELLQSLPYAATLLAVLGLVGRTRAPRALGAN